MFAQQFGQFSFACAGWTQEQEAGDGTFGIADATEVDIHPFQHTVHCVILSIQFLFDVGFQVNNLGTAFVFKSIQWHCRDTTQLFHDHLFVNGHVASIFNTFFGTGTIQQVNTLVGIFTIMYVTTTQVNCGCDSFGINHDIVK